MLKKKKILHISPTDVRYDSRILKELKALEELPDVRLSAFGINDNEGHKYDIDQREYIRIFDLWSKKLTFIPRPIRYFLNLVEAIFRLTYPSVKIKPDIIHCHDTLYLPIALIINFFCKSKIIYDAHELESDKAGQSKILSRYTLSIEKIAWRKIDLLISVSPSIIKWYDTNLGKKESLLILNSPMLNENELTKLKNNYLREKFNISNDEKIFLYLGIISGEGRGVKLYLDVFRRKDIHSHIVFVGYGEYASEIEKVAANYHNIHYHSSVPHHKVVEVSRSADIGLCLLEPISLSDYYCLPNKLFEYAFSGLFILASDFPDIHQIVENYSLGKCCSLDTEEIYKSVKSIETIDIKLTDKNLYPLSWDFQSEKLLEGYEKLIKN